MIGSIFESMLSIVLLIVVNRMVGEAAGGVFTLAFSHSQLMYYLATLETRPIQSTDVEQKYSFASYFTLRGLSCVMMLVLSIAYVLFMDGDPFKKRVILYLCLYRMVEALLDVFAAMFQQHDRIEYSGKVSTLRITVSLVLFTAVLWITKNLEWACIALLLVTVVTLFTYNLDKWREFPDATISFETSQLRSLLIACFPLFLSVFVMLYISNAPKYAIDRYCTDVVQNRYSILFMPAFVINLFSQFFFRPLLAPMASLWSRNDMGSFSRKLGTLLGEIAAITAVCLAGAWLLGIPVLSVVYHVDLSNDKDVLMWVMIYGGLNAVNILLYNMVAVARVQKWLLASYPIAAAVAFVFSPLLVQASGMRGAIAASISSMVVLDLSLVIILAVAISGKKKRTSSV